MSIVRYLDETKLKSFHIILLAIAFLVYMFAAMNTIIISPTLPRISEELQLNPVNLGFLLSIGFVGMLFGALAFGWLGDIIGRKPALVATIAIHSIFTALFGTTHDYNLLLLYRFLAGLGLGGVLPIPGVYISEYTPAKYRGTFVGLIETAWVWGTILSIVISIAFLPTWDWEGVFLWGILSVILLPAIIVFLPETVRYLEEKGKIDQAIEILERYNLIEKKISVETIKKEDRRKIKFQELFGKEYVKKTLLIMTLWFILVYTYYGVFLWLTKILREKYNLLGSLIWTLIIIIAQIPGYYSAALLLDKIGRKKVLSIYLISASIGSLIVALAEYMEIGTIKLYGYEIGVLLLLGFLLISFFNLGAWSGLYTYTPELFPTEYRATGSGIGAATGRFAGILQPIITAIMLSSGGLIPVYLKLFFLHLLGGLAVLLFGIETKQLRLEEI